ncbi:MAG: tetratricopeptide repeat protein, partial [Desulfobacterales bacterium]|nr:tetratricopeptide repeat protein [Desulfobacterales bacterium]
MKKNIIKFIIIITIISISSGCTSIKKIPQPSVKHPTISNAPDSSYYFFTRAQIARKKGDFEKAIQNLEKAIRIDPD